MKRLLLAVCIALFCALSAFPETLWQVKPMTDSFGDETGEKYVVGVFENGNNSVSIVAEQGSLYIRIWEGNRRVSFYDKPVMLIKKSDGFVLALDTVNRTGTIYINAQSGENETDSFMAAMLSANKYGRINDFREVLMSGEKIRMSIQTDSKIYLFEIDTSGFSEAFSQLGITP